MVIYASTITGPSSSESPYVVGTQPGVVTKSVLTAGDTPLSGGYRMAGIPDGLGAFDNEDGTFTLLMNHEFGSGVGVIRAHGAKGAFVSKWVISKNDLTVMSGEDLIQNVHTWNGTGWAAHQTVAFNRFCSATLAPINAFYNAESGRGYNGRIYTNGEETTDGRAWAHLLSGDSYQLAALGRLGFENVVPHPDAGDYTVVMAEDDTSPRGQVYVFRGMKQTYTGSNPIEAAGLASGTLYGIRVPAIANDMETNDSALPLHTPSRFEGVSLGDARSVTQTSTLETTSNNAHVTLFQRPEDGTWDPWHPNDFYFVTTASFTGRSRLWRLRYDSAANPAAGGWITMLLDGNEGQKMMDNITIDRRGRLIIQEDPGEQDHIAKVWALNTSTATLSMVAQHDPERFAPGAPDFLTIDEESSGVIDMGAILGDGWYLLDVQAHYANGTELVEGGQLVALHVPPGKPLR